MHNPSSLPRLNKHSHIFNSHIFDSYVLRLLLISLCALTFGSVALIVVTQSLHFISIIVQHGLSLGAFVHLTFLMIPSLTVTILPLSTFLVILFIYQKLTQDHELIIMSAAGLSPLQRARPGLYCAFLATFICYILSLWLAPLSYHAFHRYEYEIKNRIAAFLINDGVFTSIPSNLTLYVQHHDRENIFHHIMIEDTHTPHHIITIFAQTGNIVPQNNGVALFLSHGLRQDYNLDTQQLTALNFDQDSFTLLTNNKNALLNEDPSERSLKELISPPPTTSISIRHKNLVEAWNRLTMPLSCLSYSLIALLSILKAKYSRHRHFIASLFAIIITLALLLLSLSIKSLAERHTHLLPFMSIEFIIPIIICFIALLWHNPSQIKPL